ncbi:MAG TPA: MBL fold metallo-hydrolase [Pseudonocardia sp.]|uniref:MBL fold metallo-hydrolase n=1 Tax=Pseudonocardia sp. TaxID=60912 RepID=UPI002B4AC45E|nr:MBL fold metallo-hydrolase [Pseudonocardia sp.]HLU55185.1 MBL fold metallo-hydrolase [Pseudonocardia sp.]
MQIVYIGGPTALLELDGVRVLLDPTFDPPGAYPIGDRALIKTAGPALDPDAVGPVDAVLLSHDQHPDNLDEAGRAFLASAPLVLSTRSAAERVPGVTALPNWTDARVGDLRVIGVPARHGPDGTERLVGEVTGFVLHGSQRVYVSGDNASLAVVHEVARRTGPVDVAILFAGGARTPLVDGFLTLPSDAAAEAARILDARHVVVLHVEQWAHFTQGPATVREAFFAADLADRLVLPPPGEPVTIG